MLEPYRHAEVVRVEQCASCERRLERRQKALARLKRVGLILPWSVVFWTAFGFVVQPQPTTAAVLLLLLGISTGVATVIVATAD